MKIAVVIPGDWYSDNPSKFSVNLHLYTDAIRSLGHDPVIVCRNDSEYTASDPVVSVAAEVFCQPSFWRDLNLDVAIVFTWLRHSALLSALRDAEVYTVSRADVDGMMSVRVFPKHHFMLTMSGAGISLKTLASLRHLLRRYTTLYKAADAETLASLNMAQAIMIETEAAQANIHQLLLHYQEKHLATKLFVQPHYAPLDFLTHDISPRRAEKIVAIGRWDDPQKNVILLTKALNLYLSKHPNTEVILIGRGGEDAFAPLTSAYDNVKYLGVVTRDKIKFHLAECRLILFTSRWEGAPVSASETLALGGTIVGTPIPGIQGFVMNGAYGTVSKGHKPAHIADALEEEMTLWEEGKRDAGQIAEFWRSKLSALNSMSKIIQMANEYSETKRSTLNGTAITTNVS